METVPNDVNEEFVSVEKTTTGKEECGDQNSGTPDGDDVSVAGNEIRATPQDQDDVSVVRQEFRTTNGSGSYNGTVLERFATSTECLGIESSTEYVTGGNFKAEMAVRSRSRNRRPRLNRNDNRTNNFPPLLTILNRNGRPRFNLKKIREDGRLLIVAVPNDRPEVLRSHQSDGRLEMRLIDGGDHQEPDDDHEEEESGNYREVEEIEGGDTVESKYSSGERS